MKTTLYSSILSLAFALQTSASADQPTLRKGDVATSNRQRIEEKSAIERGTKRAQLFKNLKDKIGEPPPGSLTVLGITAGKSTMIDVGKVLGPSNVIVTGDASTNEGSSCFRGSNGVVAIFTSDEVSPGVGGIELYLSQKASGRQSCSKSDKIDARLGTESGIHLGSKRTEVHKRLGEPAKVSDDYEVYSWSLPIPGECKRETFYIVQFKDNLAISLQIGSHDSC